MLAYSQTSPGFNYQGVVRNSDGSVVAGQNVNFRFSILDSESTAVYTETHTATTGPRGLVELVIGTGSVVSGSFSGIDWSAGGYSLKVELDPAGGTSYTLSETRLLHWVPYAKHSEKTAGIAGGKLEIMGDASQNDEEALFEVKRNDGQTVFAVYPDGVRVYVEDPPGKGSKGGFAVGGFDPTKGLTSEFLRVSPDSVRIYVAGEGEKDGKGPKGGFAVGGFNPVKGPGDEYFRVTPDSVRIYIEEGAAKGPKGGFAVGGFNPVKGLTGDYFNVSGKSEAEIYAGEPRVLWYPLKEAFLAGNVLVQHPDSVGTNSWASGYRSKAVGNWSQALGFEAVARGNYSTSIGYQSVAARQNSFAFGQFAQARNEETYAFGRGAIAEGYRSYAFGSAGVDSAGAVTGVSYAKGDYSFAAGQGSQALGLGSFAIGLADTARGDFTIALGYKNNAIGKGSASLGYKTTAIGGYSTSMGSFTTAEGYFSTAMGAYTRALGENSMALGFSTQAREAYSTAMGFLTRAYGTYSTAMGCWTEAGGTYSTAMGYSTVASGSSSFAAGSQSLAIGGSSTAMGNSTTASGSVSTAMGFHSTASGNYSTAMGYYSTADGYYSVAMGRNNMAGSLYSVAIGCYNTAGGSYSTALGTYNTSPSGYETVIGAYNTSYSPASPDGWNTSDRLFVIGNGISTSARSNAVTVLKNGRIGLQTVTYPSYALELPNSSNIGIGQARAYAWTTYSDGRAKTDRNLLPYGLEEVMQLEPQSYFHHSTTGNGNEIDIHTEGSYDIGLIAQEVYEIIPEAVSKPANEEKDLWSMSYDKLVTVLIKAIQEQQAIIQDQKLRIANLEQQQQRLNELETMILRLQKKNGILAGE